MRPNNGGPPDKITFLETAGSTSDQTAQKLTDLWNQGYTGPYVVVGTTIYVAGYKK